MKTMSLKIPAELDAKLSALAEQRAMSKSAVVREALETFLVKPGTSSLLDLASDLVGCLEGPGDLSYNKDHLRGFGE